MTFSRNEWWGHPHRDIILSGLVVAIAVIPEAIAFSGIAGVDPRVGLFGVFLLSVMLAAVAGRTAMITSATGSTALLMTGLVQQGDALGEGMGLHCWWRPSCSPECCRSPGATCGWATRCASCRSR